MGRPGKHLDWSVAACGLSGHVTYAPTEHDLRERLQVTTPTGSAWRCLRCGTYVLGEPQGAGPADEAPLVRRGPALRDAVILRLLAVERLVKGAALVALAFGILRFDQARGSMSEWLAGVLPLLAPLSERVGYNLAESAPVHLATWALGLGHSTLLLVAAGVGLYGALQLSEAVGLWLMKRWGEYLAAVATSLFIPLEVYELVERVTVVRVVALLVNLAAVAYLVWTKRLFGIRGGHAAYEAERHSASLIEVETAAIRADLHHRGPRVSRAGSRASRT